MSPGRLLDQNQKHVCSGKTGLGLGKGHVCSAGVTEEKHIEETSQMVWCSSAAILAEPGCWERALQKQQSAKMGFYQLLTAGSSFLFFFTLARPTLSLPSFLHPKLALEGGEGSSTPLLQRHRASMGPGAETEFSGYGFLEVPQSHSRHQCCLRDQNLDLIFRSVNSPLTWQLLPAPCACREA